MRCQIMETNIAYPKADRWLMFLLVTVATNLISQILWPMLTTDAFTWGAFAASIGPVIAGFLFLFTYRILKREKYISWFALSGAIFWLFVVIGPTVEYGGRSR